MVIFTGEREVHMYDTFRAGQAPHSNVNSNLMRILVESAHKIENKCFCRGGAPLVLYAGMTSVFPGRSQCKL